MVITEISLVDGMFGALCAVLFIILYFSLMIIIFSKRYVVLKSYCNYIAMVQILFANIILWSSFIINQLDAFSDIILSKNYGCTLCVFVIPYVFGFMPWFLLQEYRMLRHGFVFNSNMRMLSLGKKKFIYSIVFFISCSSIMIICIAIVGSTRDVFVHNRETCNSMLVARIMVMLWVLIHHIGVLIGCYLIDKNIAGPNWSQYSCVKDISLYGIVVTIMCFYIQNNNFSNEGGWRLSYTVLELSFFSFAFFRTVGYRLLKCLIRDKNYLKNVCNSFAVHDLIMENIWDIYHSDSMVKELIGWIQEQPKKIDERRIPKRVYEPTEIGNCYMSMRQWTQRMKEKFADRAKGRTDGEDICNKYIFKRDGLLPKQITESLYKNGTINYENELLFVDAELYLFGTISHLWGNQYLFNYKNKERLSGGNYVNVGTDDNDDEISLIEGPRKKGTKPKIRKENKNDIFSQSPIVLKDFVPDMQDTGYNFDAIWTKPPKPKTENDVDKKD